MPSVPRKLPSSGLFWIQNLRRSSSCKLHLFHAEIEKEQCNIKEMGQTTHLSAGTTLLRTDLVPRVKLTGSSRVEVISLNIRKNSRLVPFDLKTQMSLAFRSQIGEQIKLL